MPDDCYQPKFPDEVENKIREIAEETGASYDEVVNSLMHAFFEMVDNPEKKDVPAFVEKVRKVLPKQLKVGST